MSGDIECRVQPAHSLFHTAVYGTGCQSVGDVCVRLTRDVANPCIPRGRSASVAGGATRRSGDPTEETEEITRPGCACGLAAERTGATTVTSTTRTAARSCAAARRRDRGDGERRCSRGRRAARVGEHRTVLSTALCQRGVRDGQCVARSARDIGECRSAIGALLPLHSLGSCGRRVRCERRGVTFGNGDISWIGDHCRRVDFQPDLGQRSSGDAGNEGQVPCRIGRGVIRRRGGKCLRHGACRGIEDGDQTTTLEGDSHERCAVRQVLGLEVGAVERDSSRLSVAGEAEDRCRHRPLL